jgi:hypothetical protein
MKGIYQQLKEKLNNQYVVFYEWKGNDKYILDQYGRIYLKSTKEMISSKDVDSLDNYVHSLIGMDKHQAALYNIEITKKL